MIRKLIESKLKSATLVLFLIGLTYSVARSYNNFIDLRGDRKAAQKMADRVADKFGFLDGCKRKIIFYRNAELYNYIVNRDLENEFKNFGISGIHSISGFSFSYINNHEDREAIVWVDNRGGLIGFMLSDLKKSKSKGENTIYQLKKELDYWGIDLADYTFKSKKKIKMDGGELGYEFDYDHSKKFKGANLGIKFVMCQGEICTIMPTYYLPADYKEPNFYNSLTQIDLINFIYLALYIAIIVLLISIYNRIRFNWKGATRLALFSFILMALNIWNVALGVLFRYKNSVNPLYIFSFFFAILIMSIFNALYFAVVEALDAAIFPNRISFFESLSPSIWNSRSFVLTLRYGAVLGLLIATIGSCAQFAAFSFLGCKIYSPHTIELLFFKNASLLSFCSSFSTALYEELLFRVIPLSIALLLFRKYKKGWIMPLALILQTLIFSLAHGSYFMSPAYLKFLLISPFGLTLGWVYLRYGITTAIFSHLIHNFLSFSFAFSSGYNLIFSLSLLFIPFLYDGKTNIADGQSDMAEELF